MCTSFGLHFYAANVILEVTHMDSPAVCIKPINGHHSVIKGCIYDLITYNNYTLKTYFDQGEINANLDQLLGGIQCTLK